MLQPSTIKFLKDLKKNNNKPWFDKNRKEYEKAKADFSQFIQQVIDQLAKKDPSVKSLVAKDCMFASTVMFVSQKINRLIKRIWGLI